MGGPVPRMIPVPFLLASMSVELVTFDSQSSEGWRPRGPGSMAGNRLPILDDDPHALRLLSSIGRDQAYEVVATSSVAEFLEAFGSVEPSVIVLNLQYRDGDGIGVMSILKERRCTVPIILVSGFDERVLDTARRVGEANQLRIIGALKKPVHLRAIKPLLDRHREPTESEWAAEIREGLQEEQ